MRENQTFYGMSHILHGISMEVNERETVVLLGRNGMGKSTTLKSIMGLVQPTRGWIKFKGKEITGLKPHVICHLGVGYVPEERRIFPNLTVKENLLVGLKKSNANNPWTIDRIYNYFPNLKEREKNRGGVLSGGEQQMLTIGRTMMGNPELLLIDEPTEGLAPQLVEMVTDILRCIHEEGISILLVEQTLDVVRELAKRVYVLAKGTIVFEGTYERLAENDEVRRRYLEV